MNLLHQECCRKASFSADNKRLYRPFCRIVCKLNFRIFKKSFKRYPLIQDIADCSACQTFRQSSPLVFFAEFEKFFYLISRIFLPNFCGLFKSVFPFFSGIFRVDLLKCKDFLNHKQALPCYGAVIGFVILHI